MTTYIVTKNPTSYPSSGTTDFVFVSDDLDKAHMVFRGVKTYGYEEVHLIEVNGYLGIYGVLDTRDSEDEYETEG